MSCNVGQVLNPWADSRRVDFIQSGSAVSVSVVDCCLSLCWSRVQSCKWFEPSSPKHTRVRWRQQHPSISGWFAGLAAFFMAADVTSGGKRWTWFLKMVVLPKYSVVCEADLYKWFVLHSKCRKSEMSPDVRSKYSPSDTSPESNANLLSLQLYCAVEVWKSIINRLYICVCVCVYLVSLMVLSRAADSSRLSFCLLKDRPRICLLWMGTYWLAFMLTTLTFFTPQPEAGDREETGESASQIHSDNTGLAKESHHDLSISCLSTASVSQSLQYVVVMILQQRFWCH